MNERTILRPTAARLGDLKLSSNEGFVFTQIDGASSLGEISDLTGVPLDRVIRIARRLMDLGAVEGEAKNATPARVRAAAIDESLLVGVPRRTARDVYRMKIDPSDAFVLSCVDGELSIAQLADLIGAAPSKVLRSIEALATAGAVEIVREAPRRRSVRALRASKSSMRAPSRAAVKAATKATPAAPTAPAAPAARCDLDAEAIAEIEAASRGVVGATHYAILGVATGVSTKELRRAYFALAAKLHPDRFFRKDLGPYKKLLDEAFRSVTASYEVLRVEATRAAYDVSLGLVARAAAPPVKVAPPPSPVHIPAEAKQRATRPSKKFEKPSSAQTPAARPSKKFKKPSSAQIAASVKAIPQPVMPSAVTVRSAPPPPPSAKEVTLAPRSSGVGLANLARVERLLADAQKALDDGDALGASNAYRLVLQLSADAATRSYAESRLAEACAVVAEAHAKTARAAEKASQWSVAVDAYGKAVRNRPSDPDLCERLANALREEGHDLSRAAELAEQAVARAPRRASYRKTLGRIHAESGNRAKALAQFEDAFAIEPDEETERVIAKLRKPARG